MTTSGMKPLLIVIYMSVFSLITPLGIGIGMGLTSSSDLAVQNPAVTILQGMWPMPSLHNVNKQLSIFKKVNNQLSIFKNVNKQL